MKSAVIIIDVQRGYFDTEPRPADADAVIARINQLTSRARKASVPVVFVQHADDWRHDTLGVAGHPMVKTPNLDRLAAEGLRFTRAHVTTSNRAVECDVEDSINLVLRRNGQSTLWGVLRLRETAIEMSRSRKQSLISASEVAEFVFCAKAWQLKRAGALPQSPHLEPGKQFHQQHNARVSSAARLRRLGLLCAALALLLLIAAALVRGFENLTR